jgi:hypothetical protein
MSSRILKPNIVSVCKGTGSRSRHHWVNIQQEATAILTAYPRRELLFKVEEDEEDGPRYFVGVMPVSVDTVGRKLCMPRNDGRSQTTCPEEVIPIGHYTLKPEPEYFEEMDWYELVPVNSEEANN